jgi:hypothetical protein
MKHLPKLIYNLFHPNVPKILVSLRDPVDRAYSGYKMTWQYLQSHGIPIDNQRFEDDIIGQYNVFNQRGWLAAPPPPPFLFPHAINVTATEEWRSRDRQEFRLPSLKQLDDMDYFHGSLARGMYYPQIQNWLQYFTLNENIMILKYDDFLTSKFKTLQRILQFIGYDQYDNFTLSVNDLQEDYSPYSRARNKSMTAPPPLTNMTKAYLKAFYKPYNDALADLLGDDWRNIWD